MTVLLAALIMLGWLALAALLAVVVGAIIYWCEGGE